ncbi:MAG: YjgP/YjgQ family permease [Alphaproteobacteria bacterium]|nr:YjgP/YjgQ family permease [Alphaproteobacteria bacterium]
MNSLDKYILRQCLTPLLMILIVITSIVWMTQSLQRIEIIVKFGQGLGVFAYLSILIIPSLLAIIIPFALFGAAVFALHRLHTDSEIAVMFAAGVSRWRLAAPILLITLFGALATLYVNTDLMPRSYRILKQTVADIRADFASSVIRSGEFMTYIDGFTIYVDEARPGGQFVGLLVNDYRNKDDPKTYMARKAILRDTGAGPMLILKDGNIQRTAKDTGVVDFIRFGELAVNISSFQNGRSELVLELTERYPRELLNPDMSKPYDRANAARLIAEGHARFAGPLYAFAYVFVGLYAMLGGAYSRRGYVVRIAAAGAVIFAVRIIGFLVQGLVETSAAYWLLYAVPGVVIVIFAALLFAPMRWRARMVPAPSQEAA